MSDPFTWLAEPFAGNHFMWRAALACVLLGVGASLLGCVMVVRRLALLGDALAHALLPGVGIAWLLFGTSLTALLVGGLAAGLLTALGSALLSRLTRVKEDAAFAALFVVLFAAGVALVSRLGTPIDLLHFLFGNVLGIGGPELWLAATVSSLTVGVFALFYRGILMECFDPSFFRASGGHGALVHLGILTLIVLNLVAALHALGAVLALGLFLLPAVTAYLWCDRWGTMLAFAVIDAVAGSLAGLVLSYHTGLASGPGMVIVLGAGFLLSAALSSRHGLLGRFLRPDHHHQEESDETCAVSTIDGDAAPERHP
jgi:zinc/manganese transport system permease protein